MKFFSASRLLRTRRIIKIFLGGIWCLVAIARGQAAESVSPQPGLRAAVVKIDVTPDTPKMLLGYAARQSTGVLDRIHHRILVLDDGQARFFLVASEFCVMSPSLYDKVADRLTRDHGIPRENFWWALTHTHSAPEVGPAGLPAVFMAERYQHKPDAEYTAFVEDSLVSGIEEAMGKLQPVQLGVGWGHSQANINRRARNVAGQTKLGMNPDGPVDRRIGVLQFTRLDGTPLALVANYPIHGTVLGAQNLQISGDAPGVVSNYVERKTGAVMLFINGAAGNLAPIYSVQPDAKTGHLDEFELLLGERILDAARAPAWRPDQVALKIGSGTIETARRHGLGWSEDLAAYARTNADGTGTVRIPVRFLRINREVAIWGAPLELFCEISNEVRERSPFPYTFFFGYLNGWLGYLPTEQEFKFGGYEPKTSPFTPAVEREFREGVLGYLHGELRR